MHTLKEKYVHMLNRYIRYSCSHFECDFRHLEEFFRFFFLPFLQLHAKICVFYNLAASLKNKQIFHIAKNKKYVHAILDSRIY